jgi:microcin C transport system permease protein
MVLFSWTGLTYYVRAAVYKEKPRDYIAAAQVIGAGPLRIIFKHLLPNVISTLVTFAPFTIAAAISSITALDSWVTVYLLRLQAGENCSSRG